jgi:AraC-like DNA-binding protein
MVCQRCVSVVARELALLDLPFHTVSLGEVFLKTKLDENKMNLVKQSLQKHGFEVLRDNQMTLVKEVKNLVEQMFSKDFDLVDFKFSKYIADKLHKDYDVISSSFSACQGITLEKYILNKRIDKVKEYLLNTNQLLSDISYSLGFSSVSHLSTQFKVITGYTPSNFKKIEKVRQSSPDIAT